MANLAPEPQMPRVPEASAPPKPPDVKPAVEPLAPSAKAALLEIRQAGNDPDKALRALAGEQTTTESTTSQSPFQFQEAQPGARSNRPIVGDEIISPTAIGADERNPDGSWNLKPAQDRGYLNAIGNAWNRPDLPYEARQANTQAIVEAAIKAGVPRDQIGEHLQALGIKAIRAEDIEQPDATNPEKVAEDKPRQVENDPQFRQLLQANSLRYLETQDREWFHRDFSGQVAPSGYLLDNNGNETPFLPSQNVGPAGWEDVNRQTREDFARLYPDIAKGYEIGITQPDQAAPPKTVVAEQGQPDVAHTPEPNTPTATDNSSETVMDRTTAAKILGSDRTATNAEKIAAATQYPDLAERWGWSQEEIEGLRQLTVTPETQQAMSQEIKTIQEKIWRVSRELSPEEARQLVAEIQSSLPLLNEALKQDYFYLDTLDIMANIGMASVIGRAPELNKLRSAFIEQNLDVMAQAAAREASSGTGNTRVRERTIANLGYVISMGNEDQRSQVLSCLDSHRAEWIQNPADIEIFQSYFNPIFEHGTIEQRMNAADLVVSFYNSEDPAMKEAGIKMIKVYYDKFSDKPYPASEIKNPDDPIYRQVTEIIGQYVPDIDDLVQKTLFSGPVTKEKPTDSGNLGTRLVENMETILSLEQQRPGICQTLRKEFGIRNFYRYSPDILISQYDNRDTLGRKGIVAVALYDHNGAFSQDSSQQARHSLFTQLQDEQAAGEKYGLMIYEIGDSRELVRAVANARRRTPDRKLSFGIVEGHGTEDSVQFGEYFIGRYGFGTIRSSDVENSIAPSIAGAFEDGAPILFNSCSTGQGIVREASKLGLKVSGPTQDTSIKSYSVSSEQGHLDIEAEWTVDKATYHSGVKL